MAHRVAPHAEADLDEIWLYVARGSSSAEIADHLIERIASRFNMLARFPHADVLVTKTSGQDTAVWQSANTSSCTASRMRMHSFFAWCMAAANSTPSSAHRDQS